MSSDRVLASLDALDATYERIEIDPALADTAAFCEHYGYGLEVSANAILVASKRPPGRYAVCVLLATTRLDVNHRVRAEMAVSKLSFADPDVTREVTGMEIGGVTPFGLPDDLALMIDARVMQLERCIVGGGSRDLKVKVDPEVFGRMPSAAVVDGLAISV